MRDKGMKVGMARLRTIRPYPTDRVNEILSKFKVVGVIETNMGLGSVSSGGSLYAEVCAALYESQHRPLVLSFMAGMGGEAIVLKEFYWMTEKMLDVQKRGKIEKRTHWVGFEE
jgi:pyruvate ferredoxin oxidoreductase alpha subunit/oxalate oxidoreductase subunit alpha